MDLGTAQYVILGAGLDTFCFRHPVVGDLLQLFEVDHPATQTFKMKRLADAHLDIPNHLHFVPMDFTRDFSKQKLVDNGFKNKRTFFSLLGVTYYPKRTQWILIISTMTSLLHTGLNYLLIYGHLGFPKSGVAGAAISSMITMSVDVLAYCWLLRKDLQSALHVRPDKILLIIRQSIPLMGQELLQGSLFAIVLNAILARLGALTLSGYLLIRQLLQIGFIPAFMYSSALLTLISESSGARQFNDLKAYPKTASILTMILFSLTGIVFYLLRTPIAGLITNDQRLIGFSSGIFLLLWLARLFNPLQEIYKSAMQSIGKSTRVLLITFIIHTAALVIIIALTFLLHLGIYGIAISLFIDELVMYLVLKMTYDSEIQRMPQKRTHP